MSNDLLAELLLPAGAQYSYPRRSSEEKESSELRFEHTLNEIENAKDQGSLMMLGVPFDNGAGFLRGTSFGPHAIRNSGVDFQHVKDLGDLKIIPQLLHDSMLNESQIGRCRPALYGAKVKEAETNGYPVSPLSILSKVSESVFKNLPRSKLLTIGGDHSISFPLIQGLLSAGNIQPKDLMVIHFDAHTDLFEHHAGIEYCFSTWAFHVNRMLGSSESLVQVGIRAGKRDKRYWEEKHGVKQFWASQFNDADRTGTIREIIDLVVRRAPKAIYVTLDVDVLGEEYFRSCGTPEKEGLKPIDVVTIIEQLMLTHIPIVGADLVEFSPFAPHPDDQSRANDLKIVRELIEVLIKGLST